MSLYHSGLHKVVEAETPYMVSDPGNGRMRRYEVSKYTVRCWNSLVDRWPSVAIPALKDAFEQEVEKAIDGYSWSGGSMQGAVSLEILLDLAEKKASGKF